MGARAKVPPALNRGRGGTGRHTGLKIPRPVPCGFESRRPHQFFGSHSLGQLFDREAAEN